MAKTIKKHMSTQDKEDWTALYEYVRKNVMGYDENQSLSRNMVLRLKGILNNKFMANNNIADSANYSYETVLNTFKFCILDIRKVLSSYSFKDENHKFNYILKIVENNLNTVYVKTKNAEKAKEKTEEIIETMAIDNNFNSMTNYQTKTSETSNRLNDLWGDVL